MRRVRLGSGSTVNLIRLGFGRTVIASDEDLETLLDYDFEALPSRQIRIWRNCRRVGRGFGNAARLGF